MSKEGMEIISLLDDATPEVRKEVNDWLFRKVSKDFDEKLRANWRKIAEII